MILDVVRHFLLPGMSASAKVRLAENAERMIQQPGCLFRHTAERDGGRELVSFTGWSSEQDWLAWNELRKASPPLGELSDYYSGYEIIEAHVFDQRQGQLEMQPNQSDGE